jgi:glutamate synthase domain-containing protein 3
MAELGCRTVDEMVGKIEFLEFADVSNHWKARHLDLSVILHRPDNRPNAAIRKVMDQDHGLDRSLDVTLIELAEPALESGEAVTAQLPIKNVNRTVGTMLSGEVARKFGHAGLPDDTITFKFTGSAGQSFGAFLAKGIT